MERVKGVKEMVESKEIGPRNYANPEPLNTSHIGRSVRAS